MPEAALTVQSQRHLSLPQNCLFSPSELHISASCSESDFIHIVSAVAKLGTASDMWKADYSLFAIENFGKEKGLAITAKASGLSQAHLYKCSFVARDFPPQHRWPAYNFSHYRLMQAFPHEWAYQFMSANAGKNLSSNGLRALAVKEFGKEPYEHHRQPKKRSVPIRFELYERLRPYSDSRKISVHIENILETWIKQHPIPVAVPKPVVKEEPVAVKEEPEQPRPTYEERRKKQIADGAQPIPPKEKKLLGLKGSWVQWTACRPAEFLDSEDGMVQQKAEKKGPKKFYSEADAVAAEQRNFAEKGYRELVVECDVCKAWHVAHKYTGEKQ